MNVLLLMLIFTFLYSCSGQAILDEENWRASRNFPQVKSDRSSTSIMPWSTYRQTHSKLPDDVSIDPASNHQSIGSSPTETWSTDRNVDNHKSNVPIILSLPPYKVTTSTSINGNDLLLPKEQQQQHNQEQHQQQHKQQQEQDHHHHQQQHQKQHLHATLPKRYEEKSRKLLPSLPFPSHRQNAKEKIYSSDRHESANINRYSTASNFHSMPPSQPPSHKILPGLQPPAESRSAGRSAIDYEIDDSLVPLSDRINVKGISVTRSDHRPVAKSRPYITMQAAKPPLRSIPDVYYSRLAPAPPLPVSASSNNIAESIFAQSQIQKSPFPLIANGVPSATGGAATSPLAAATSLAASPSLVASPSAAASLFGGESTIDTISKFARNILALPASNKELFSALASALTAPKIASLTGNKISDTPTATASNVFNAQQLFSSIPTKNLTASGVESPKSGKDELLLTKLPEEERSLLEAAIKSGELDLQSVASAIGNSTNTTKAIAENRLLEWIQQNRPALNASRAASTIRSDKLPYYGKYCGTLSEQADSKKQFGSSGAVWAVDDRRFVVSKFHFIPGSLDAENVTFWAGPKLATGNVVDDMFPSSNGFYLRPEPIDLTAFLSKEIKIVEARIRKPVSNSNNSTTIASIVPVVSTQNQSSNAVNASLESGRGRRSVDSEESVKKEFDVMLKGAILKAFEETRNESDSFVTYDDILAQLNETDAENVTQTSVAPSKTTTAPSKSSTSTSRTPQTTPVSPGFSNRLPQPLGWYAGFQPLLFTLPDDKWIKTVNWISLRDHKRNRTVSSVLIPNGPAFKVPAIVQLRPLVPNGVHSISSGPIKVLDTKTIEIDEFTLSTRDVPAWFVVGKDILPNGGGHIVPLYDRPRNTFDCDSLRDYTNETITLRLPGSMDIKDVFWFSVFSMSQGISLSHIYLPYNDMYLPPDLNGVATPRCVWQST